VFSPSFWLICFICVAYYVAIFPFVTLGKVYFEEKYQFSSQNANFITGGYFFGNKLKGHQKNELSIHPQG